MLEMLVLMMIIGILKSKGGCLSNLHPPTLRWKPTTAVRQDLMLTEAKPLFALDWIENEDAWFGGPVDVKHTYA